MKHKDHYNDDYILELSQKIRYGMADFDEKTFSCSLVGKLEDKELFARCHGKKYGRRLFKKC